MISRLAHRIKVKERLSFDTLRFNSRSSNHSVQAFCFSSKTLDVHARFNLISSRFFFLTKNFNVAARRPWKQGEPALAVNNQMHKNKQKGLVLSWRFQSGLLLYCFSIRLERVEAFCFLDFLFRFSSWKNERWIYYACLAAGGLNTTCLWEGNAVQRKGLRILMLIYLSKELTCLLKNERAGFVAN